MPRSRSLSSTTWRVASSALLLGACIDRQEARLDDRHDAVLPEMQAHADEASLIRDGLIAGDLGRVREGALSLRARLPLGPGLPHAAQVPEATLVAATDAILAAPDLPTAAPEVGRMAQACGACHQGLGILVQSLALSIPTPQDPSSVQARMVAHDRAAQVMWAALVAGDPAALGVGADLMKSSALLPSGSTVDAPVPEEAALLEIRAQDLSLLASRAQDDESRGRHTGELLGTCAQCHRLLRVGPGAQATGG